MSAGRLFDFLRLHVNGVRLVQRRSGVGLRRSSGLCRRNHRLGRLFVVVHGFAKALDRFADVGAQVLEFLGAWLSPPVWASVGKGGCRCPASAGLASASVCTLAGICRRSDRYGLLLGSTRARAVSDRLSWRWLIRVIRSVQALRRGAPGASQQSGVLKVGGRGVTFRCL